MATPSWKKEDLRDKGKRFVRMIVRNRRGDYIMGYGRVGYHWPWTWTRMPWEYASWLAEPWQRRYHGTRIERIAARVSSWVPAVGLRTFARHVITEGLYKLLEYDRSLEVGEALYRARRAGAAKAKMHPRYEREHRNWRDYLEDE